ncbi:MAG: Ycf66 family protein [Cyanobacteria bacterium P01_A01_bin.84]
MFNNLINLLGFILIITSIGIAALSFLRPQVFKRQDIVLITVLLICGIIFSTQSRWYRKELLQFNLFLLAAPGIFYSIDTIRLRNQNQKQLNK